MKINLNYSKAVSKFLDKNPTILIGDEVEMRQTIYSEKFLVC